VADSFPSRFLWLLAAAGAFVWLTSRSLPDVVASHFEGDGFANGFSTRGVYVGLMLGFVLGLPALVVTALWHAMGSPGARINLPNRDYWLAPERRDETVSWLRGHMVGFGYVLVLFLCYVHWLVVRANALQPPRLASSWMSVGLVAFVAFTLGWIRRLMRRFRMPLPDRR
jgi:hypothetical protein